MLFAFITKVQKWCLDFITMQVRYTNSTTKSQHCTSKDTSISIKTKYDLLVLNCTFTCWSWSITICTENSNLVRKSYYHRQENTHIHTTIDFYYSPTWLSSLVPDARASSTLILDWYFSSRTLKRLFCCRTQKIH